MNKNNLFNMKGRSESSSELFLMKNERNRELKSALSDNFLNSDDERWEVGQSISIISDDCWGGEFYRTLNLQYLTPTVGLWFDPTTYINFLRNIRNSDAFDLKFIQSNRDYPVAVTPYTTVYFQHYQTEQEARETFLRRAKRINWSRLFIKIDFGKSNAGKFSYSERDIEEWNAMCLLNSIAFYPPERFGLHLNIHHGVMIPDSGLDGTKMFEVSKQHFDLLHCLETGEIRLSSPKKLAIAHGETFPSDSYKTPATHLKQMVESLPDGELISIQTNGASITQTYSQLWYRSTSILGGLRIEKLQPGQSLVLLLDQCQDFVASLWSCLMAGFIPVPIKVASDCSQLNQALLKLADVLDVLDEAIILTTEVIGRSLDQQPSFKNKHRVIYLEQVERTLPDYDFYPSKPEDVGALYLSSGTTGKPKLVSFSCQSITNRLLANQLGNPQEISSLYWLPLDHASANFRIASPDTKRKVFLPTERFLQNPLYWLDLIEQYHITQANITNFGMALIAESIKSFPARSWDLTSIHDIGIGAEAIIPKTYRSFLSSLLPFGLNPDAIFVGYGLTECGTVVGKNVSLLSYQLASNQFLALGAPCHGYSIRVVDEQNTLLREGEIGYIQVMGPTTTIGYYGDSRETQSLFTDDGWVNTGDLGFLHNQCLTITGRAKDIIIINAKNYSCQQIEQIVESMDGVEPASTVACSIRNIDSKTDEIAIFFNTTLEDQQIVKLRNQIRKTIVTRLSVVPTYLIPIAKKDIPRTASGKVQRAVLVQRLKSGEFANLIEHLTHLLEIERQATFIAPTTKTEKLMVEIWSNIFQDQSIGIYDNFFELGGQSLLAAQVVADIERHLGINLPLATFLQAPTIQQLSSIIDRSEWAMFWQSLVPIQTSGDRPLLFCIHGGGLNVLIYRDLAVQLGADQPVYGLQAKGLDGSQPLLLSIKEMATDYVKTIKTVQPEGPYFLAGLSNGGKIAFEMARQLQSQGEAVSLVAMFDTYAPGGLRLLPPIRRLLSIAKYICQYTIPRFLKHRITFERKGLKEPVQFATEIGKNAQAIELNQLTSQEKRQKHSPEYSIQTTVVKGHLIERLVQSLNLFVLRHSPWSFLYEKVSLGQIEKSLTRKPQKIDKALCQVQQSTSTPLQVRVALFYAQERPPGFETDPLLGWGELVQGEIEVYKIPGHHTSIMQSPLLAKTLRICMDQAQSEMNS